MAFYRDAFAMEELFRDGSIVFLGTPGGGDSLALHLAKTDEERARVGHQGGSRSDAAKATPRAGHRAA
jgi:hypothetical protein